MSCDTCPLRSPGVPVRRSRPVPPPLVRAPSAVPPYPSCRQLWSPGRTATHASVVEPAPQPALLHRADLFVTHGGRASLLDAVQGATPFLGMGVLADQPGNTAAFTRRGLGRALDLTATRDEIAEAMRAVLGDPRHAAAMDTARTTLSRLPPLYIAQLYDHAQAPVRLG
ncbi:glycosyltransferase [Kitasatospora sp. NPDC085464]|uniref:glycosyltransferase n=1 Tax=Kitasatospora sp. NPDC085464 TaxID=3364063 RepID=UPI0037C57548